MPVVKTRDLRLCKKYSEYKEAMQEQKQQLDCWTPLKSYLFRRGKYYRLYQQLGAHYYQRGQVEGVRFTVWAPHAKNVRVIGSFNEWNGKRHQMKYYKNVGIWEIFIPDVKEGDFYKYEIETHYGTTLHKADPYAKTSEVRPKTASCVYFDKCFKWKDDGWLQQRAQEKQKESPMSIYEMSIGSWKRKTDGSFYTYKELAPILTEYVLEMGYTHIEFMGILEHPFDGSWGYQVTGYYAPTSRYGSPCEFKYLINYLHKNNIGVILDWVPAHFPKDDFALRQFDGQPLYEYEDPARGEHPEWGTLIFDYGRPQVKLFLIGSALSFVERYHVDGLRVDAVSSMLYLNYGRSGDYLRNQYGGHENIEAINLLKELNTTIRASYPGVLMIAEEATAWQGVTRDTKEGGLGFDFKWNMGWMNDILKYMKYDPLHRKLIHNQLTFSMMYAFNETFMLPLSHDEVVHGKSPMIYKMPGDEWKKAANLRLLYGYMFMHPGKKLLFMGNEWGQTSEWNEWGELDWDLIEYKTHQQIKTYVSTLNAFYKSNPALYELDYSFDGFKWLECNDANISTLSFKRMGKRPEDTLIVVANFTPNIQEGYRIGVPEKGEYQEVFNSDDIAFGGSGVVNRQREADKMPWQEEQYSIYLNVPPLSISIWQKIE